MSNFSVWIREREYEKIVFFETICIQKTVFCGRKQFRNNLPKNFWAWKSHIRFHISKEIDAGGAEGVEVYGLFLLVWRRNFSNDIWKMYYKQSRRRELKPNNEKCKTIICIANIVIYRHLYIQNVLHTKAFTHSSFYRQTLLHTDAFTHRHSNTFTHRDLYTQTLLY